MKAKGTWGFLSIIVVDFLLEVGLHTYLSNIFRAGVFLAALGVVRLEEDGVMVELHLERLSILGAKVG